MIEFFEVMFRALTGLKLTFPTLISLAVFFAAGYYFAATTKRLNPIKAIFALLLAYIIAAVLSGLLGVYTLAVVLGFLSNQGVFLARVLFWAESLTEILFVMRHRMAYEDIRREEGESHERAKPEAPRPPPNRPKTKQNAGSEQSFGAGSKAHGDRQSGDWKPGPGKSQADIDRCLRILELEAGRTHTQKEIKKAYRRLAMIHHPDLPTGSHDAFVKLGMALDYLTKHMAA
ncbi:DnaJ domain-containing protein [Sulfitobacter geojensis]|uniref:DnaJ domain-containing protein n=3 Tax=Sulfitobacter geojensis TaxID=1342299 RepID=A0AAE2W1U1_9RHOB|nr:DnaJ domain-containing protein [Sulfitobacter geojensis]MBM1691591.1 DnaJ domain-containing protein [Sulfitobacter geojensis]MBM1695646.1 DnaJ domain-containing protein [Sulfitobacter geojensis]MBM1707814.1 DnaJ domain-containing protein [Sulfitobacter geojensis]MBM1711887.1 DnaJ domain-containing protein [Sulfitobacter geojensis]MBM1715954.1 DnaJ domain-containing protein [Sulfitobacter geojensis]